MEAGDIARRPGSQFTGQLASGQAGISVAGAGDVDGDGFGDFLSGTRSGLAYVVFGGQDFAALDAADDGGADGQLSLGNIGAGGPAGIEGFAFQSGSSITAVAYPGVINAYGFPESIRVV